MSETETILRQESGVKDHESESPPTIGLKAGAFAELGTLILTDRRLVYISKGGAARAAAWAIGGIFAAQAIERNVSKAQIDELATQEGSYYTLLQNITRAEAGKKLGQSYVRIDGVGGAKPVHAYVVSGGKSNEEWVAAINQAKNAPQNIHVNQPTPNFAQPQSQKQNSTSFSKNCAMCGTANDSNSKFCSNCGASQVNAQPTISPPPPPPPNSDMPKLQKPNSIYPAILSDGQL